MDPVEKAITNLKSQKDHIIADCEAEVDRIKLGVDPGGKRAIKKAKDKRDGHVEVIDYIINFLENPEEEPCLD